MSDQEINPYALPVASVVSESTTEPVPQPFEPDGIWRDGKLLVIRKGAELPRRCVKCNEPADVWKRQTYTWHNPAFYFTILAGVLIYVIVYVIVRQKAQVRFGLCRRHLKKRRWAQLSAWAIAVGGIATIFLAASLVGPARRELTLPGVLLGFGAILAGVIYGIFATRLLWPKRIDHFFAWLDGASANYLAELPEIESPYQ